VEDARHWQRAGRRRDKVTNGAAARQSPLAQSPPPGRKSKEERVREREERFKKLTEEMDLFCSCFYGGEEMNL